MPMMAERPTVNLSEIRKVLRTATLAKEDVVAFAGPKEDLGNLRRALADRRGAILSFVMDKISPESYCYERSVCIDTTATGGNVSLLTLPAS